MEPDQAFKVPQLSTVHVAGGMRLALLIGGGGALLFELSFESTNCAFMYKKIQFALLLRVP